MPVFVAIHICFLQSVFDVFSFVDFYLPNLLLQHFMEGHAKSAPISRLPLISVVDTKHLLKDVPVCQVILDDCEYL